MISTIITLRETFRGKENKVCMKKEKEEKKNCLPYKGNKGTKGKKKTVFLTRL